MNTLQQSTVLLSIAKCLLWNGWYNQHGMPVPRALVVNEVNQPLYRDIKSVMSIGRACRCGCKVAKIVMQNWAASLSLARPPWSLNGPWDTLQAAPIQPSAATIVHVPGVMRSITEWDDIFGEVVTIQVTAPPIQVVQQQLAIARKIYVLQAWRVLSCLVQEELLWSRKAHSSYVAARAELRNIDYALFLRKCDALTPRALWPVVEIMAIVQLARVCRKCWRSLHVLTEIIGQVAKENARARIYRQWQIRFEDAMRRNASIVHDIEGMTEQLASSFVQAGNMRMNLHRPRLELDVMHGQPRAAFNRCHASVCLRPSMHVDHARITAAYDSGSTWITQTAAAVHAEIAELLVIRRVYGRVTPTDVNACIWRLRDPMHDYGVLSAIAGGMGQGFWQDDGAIFFG